MTNKRTISQYVEDALENMLKAQEFLKDVSEEAFYKDVQKQYAIRQAIEIIGEAARNIPSSVREIYPEIPWKDITGIRDRIAHGYYEVNLKIVWEVVNKDIPINKVAFEKIKQDLVAGKLEQVLKSHNEEIKHQPHRGRHG